MKKLSINADLSEASLEWAIEEAEKIDNGNDFILLCGELFEEEYRQVVDRYTDRNGVCFINIVALPDDLWEIPYAWVLLPIYCDMCDMPNPVPTAGVWSPGA